MSTTIDGAPDVDPELEPVAPTAEQLEPPALVAKQSHLTVVDVLGPILTLVAFVGVWEYMHRDGMRRIFDKPGRLLPSLATVFDHLRNQRVREQLIDGLGWTSYAAFVGLAITIVIGMSIAVLMARARWVERSLFPYLVALQATPVLAITPIIYTIFGGGMSSRLYVCVMISIFPVVTNTLFGLTSVEPGQHDLFTLRGASSWKRMFRLQFPAAMPAIFTGFRISAGLSVIGAIVGEQFFKQGGQPGIGVVMETFRVKGRYPELFAGLLEAALLGIAVFLLFGLVGKLVVGHWHESSRKPT